MQSFKKRLSLLEGARAIANLKTMTDDELSAYASTCKSGSKERYGAVIALIHRHPSTLPIIVDCPDYTVTDEND